MKTYDLYLFDVGPETLLGWHSFVAADEKTALEIAQALVLQPPAELWQEGRIVKRWDPGR